MGSRESGEIFVIGRFVKYGLIEPRVLQRVKRKFVQIGWELISVSNAMEGLLLSFLFPLSTLE